MDNTVSRSWRKNVLYAMMLPYLYATGTSSAYAALRALDDLALSQEVGQAAFYTSYTAPSGAGTSNFGFFNLGINGEVAINANIQHLQLGCGGVNGAAGCDLDIENLSLSGNPGVAVPTGMTTSYGGAGTVPFSAATPRPSTDALLENPFFSIAIQNPTSLSTRSIAGIQLGAQSILGLLTMGSSNSPTPNGLNSLSGYLQIAPVPQSAGSTVNIASANITAAATGNQTLFIRHVNTGIFGITASASTSVYNLTTAATTGNPLSIPGTTIVQGTRMNSVSLIADVQVNPIALSGTVTATTNILSIVLSPTTSGTITGLSAVATINESLGFIHDLPLSGQALSLSLQNQPILWPGAPVAAQTGWWLAASQPVTLGSVTPSSPISLTTGSTSSVVGQVIPPLNTWFTSNTVSGLFNIPLGAINIPSTLTAAFSNLQLSAQGIVPNCFGSLKFC